MITLEETEIIGWKHAIRGMRNPEHKMNDIEVHGGMR